MNDYSIETRIHFECPPGLLTGLRQRLGYTEDEAAEGWAELKRFLIICGISAHALAPSKAIDRIWHEAILNTREYERMCHQVCGSFIHHTPTTTPDNTAYETTLNLLRQTFGSLNSKYWPAAQGEDTDCSGCSSCGSNCGGNCSSR